MIKKSSRLLSCFSQLVPYWRLLRLDKPVGSLLLLWPTLNALWIASNGSPPLSLLLIFVTGTILMRSAGCAINDYADRDFDRFVERTRERPITSGQIAPWQALALAAAIAVLAFLLIASLNALTKWLALIAVLLAASYPLTKRFFAVPQAYLGCAFGFGIPMAFAAVQNQLPPLAWAMLIANIFWSIAYDTEYAMVDREDDRKIGIRTSALTFGQFDVLAIMGCYGLFLLIYAAIGIALAYTLAFWLGLIGAAICAAYHYRLIRTRERSGCFAAFKHNNWLGGLLFAGIAAHYALV
ncbi:MAG: 4-hydroxybenzoate polyprenyltransferase [Glomeribacter sp. 1016415]|nr:4-hydroxybenzoate polyprenyltransferase [Glomeribacter sp. 1016415]